jgi:hypothetical protein
MSIVSIGLIIVLVSLELQLGVVIATADSCVVLDACDVFRADPPL